MFKLPAALLIVLLASISTAARAQQPSGPGASAASTSAAHALSTASGSSPVQPPPSPSRYTRTDPRLQNPPGAPLRPGQQLDTLQGRGGMPKWLKLGIVGAGAGAVAFLVRGQLRVDKVPNPPQKDAAVGAAAGFILLGGGALLYDLFCPAPSSGSWRPGLCGN